MAHCGRYQAGHERVNGLVHIRDVVGWLSHDVAQDSAIIPLFSRYSVRIN